MVGWAWGSGSASGDRDGQLGLHYDYAILNRN